MATDPNHDLIGFRYRTAVGSPAEEIVTVLKTVDWSDQYVLVEFETGHQTIKPAGVVRTHKQLGMGA